KYMSSRRRPGSRQRKGAPLRTNAWTPASAGATKVGLTSSRTTTRFECGVTPIHVVPAQAGIRAKKGRAAAHECLDSGLRRSDEGGSHIFLEQSCVSAKVIFLASLRVLCERPFLFNSTATRNLETLRDRRTLQEMLQRSRHVREVGDADELARAVEADEIANPGEGRDVRDRVFLAHQPRSALEACVQDAEQPTRLADVAVARPLVFELAPGELM